MKSLAEILTGLAARVQTKEIEVGTVDVQLARELQLLKSDHNATHREIKRKIVEFAEALKAEHQPACDEYHTNVENLWKKIYEAVGISPEEGEAGNFSIDSRTGVVTQTLVDTQMIKKEGANDNA